MAPTLNRILAATFVAATFVSTKALSVEDEKLVFNDRDFVNEDEDQTTIPAMRMAEVQQVRAAAVRRERELAGEDDIAANDTNKGRKLHIASLRPGVSCKQVMQEISNTHRRLLGEDFDDTAFALEHVAFEGATQGEECEFMANDDEASFVARSGLVADVEEDGDIVMTTSKQRLYDSGMWGIDRVDAAYGLDGYYEYDYTGKDVDCYVLDTGISHEHSQFRHRDTKVADGMNFVRDSNNRLAPGFPGDRSKKDSEDCHGHGSHVAGIINSRTFGGAKGCRVVPLRVLDCYGGGKFSWVIHAIEYILKTVKSSDKVIVNMSLGGRKSTSMNRAIQALVDKGIVVVVAGGNESADACDYSPASAENAITVGATDKLDRASTAYTNYGSCIDMYAPGSQIKSAWTGASRTVSISGTSMAAPHVVCAVALLWEKYPSWNDVQIKAELKRIAITDRLSMLQPQLTDPNRFVQFPRVKQQALPPSKQAPVIVTSSKGDIVRFASAQFGAQAVNLGLIGGELVKASPSTACSPLSSSVDYTGKIVVVLRGVCNFYEKAQNVERAGGKACIIQNVAGDYYFELGVPRGTSSKVLPHILTVLVSRSDGKKLLGMTQKFVAIGPPAEGAEALGNEKFSSVAKPTASPTNLPTVSPTSSPTHKSSNCKLRLTHRIGNSMDMKNPKCMYEFQDPTTKYIYTNRCAYSKTPKFGMYRRWTYWSMRRRFNTRGWCMTSETTWAACYKCD